MFSPVSVHAAVSPGLALHLSQVKIFLIAFVCVPVKRLC